MHFRVSHITKADTRVLRCPAGLGHIQIEELFDLLAQQIQRPLDVRRHLAIVSEREVVDGGCVRDALCRILSESASPIVGVLVKEIEKHAHVFEACIHTLTIKGNHGVGSITNDDACRGIVVGRAFDGYQGEVLVRGVLYL